MKIVIGKNIRSSRFKGAGKNSSGINHWKEPDTEPVSTTVTMDGEAATMDGEAVTMGE